MNLYKSLVIVLILFICIVLFINRKYFLSITLAIRMSSQKFEKNSNNLLRFRFFFPKTEDGKLYPLIIYLHGGGQRGEDNLKQLNSAVSILVSRNLQKKNPSFVIAPQCPIGKQWLNTTFKKTPYDHYDQNKIAESPEIKMIAEVINQYLQKYPIDKNRIYILGFSMGSSGTWDFISRHPELFAAAVPISGVSDTTTAKRLTNIPIWAFHGEEDNIAPLRLNKEMQESINARGGSCKLTVFKGVGHGCEKQALNYPGLIEWLFNQRRN